MCTATDAHNNSTNQTFHVVVRDTTPPTLSLPNNMTKEATGPAGATVTYSASASDIVDGAVAVNCSPSSGSTFALGTINVNCSATDSHGNTSSGSFTVTVQDTTPPALTLPANITTEATGPSGASVSYSASATDFVDGPVAVSCDHASGNTFAIGTTTVRCSAMDSHGNTASGSFSVTVQDHTPPIISGVPASITAEATSPSGAAVSYINPTASDLVDGSVAVSCSPASGSTFALGTTTVLCSATDAHGNKSSANFIIKVQDTIKPNITITTPANGAVYTLNQNVAANFSCSDSGSGVASCGGTVANGSNLDTASVGSKSFTVVATDKAGNTETKTVTYTVVYQVRLLYDPTQAKKSGSTIPIKLQLTDINNVVNLSSPNQVLTAVGIGQTSNSISGQVGDSGNANPDLNFRFDSTLGGTGGYIFNLSTTGLSTGSYMLGFRIGNATYIYAVPFQVK
jgi:hypothetical protein